MRCTSALSTARDTETAAREVLGRVAEGLGGEGADLAVAFGSAAPRRGARAARGGLRGPGIARHVLACTGESIVGEGREVEGPPP